jgi:hypothetical protein
MGDSEYIEVGGQQFLRARVTAKLHLANDTAVEPASAKAVASQLHIPDTKNPDLVHVQFILDTEGGNSNWDYMPREQLVKSHATAIFKPIDMEHVIVENDSMTLMSKDNPPVRNTTCGVMTATELCWASTGKGITGDELEKLDLADKWDRPDDEKIAVRAWGALYRFLFPKTVDDLLESINDGNMSVSMERWIGKMDFMAWDGADYLAYAKTTAEDNGVANRWKVHQSINAQPVYRRSLSYIYGGVANTTNPANKLCRFSEPEMEKAAASCQDRSQLELLMKWHDSLHDEFELATSVAAKQAVIQVHEKVTRDIVSLLGK